MSPVVLVDRPSLDKRIAFLDATGVPQGSPRYNNDFLYLGQNVDLFQEVFSSIGEVRLGGA